MMLRVAQVAALSGIAPDKLLDLDPQVFAEMFDTLALSLVRP